MADPTDKYHRNVAGSFYNDNSCIDCDICREIAPSIFRRDDDDAQSYVWRQPRTAAQLALAYEALESCPTDTIGFEV